jgi:predicted acylesterase/phospholipase RssA
MLGVVIRNSAGAIVAYFVYSALLPTIFGILAANQEWFRDVQAWVDFSYAQSALFNGAMTGDHWAHLGTTALLWLFIPMAAGLWKLMRSEVK